MHLLIDLAERGILVQADGETLHLTPASQVPADWLGQIREHKPALLNLLRYDDPEPYWSPAIRCYATIRRIAYFFDVHSQGLDDDAPDDVAVADARALVPRIIEQQAQGYFTYGRFLQRGS